MDGDGADYCMLASSLPATQPKGIFSCVPAMTIVT
jgi:hypothetical protein